MVGWLAVNVITGTLLLVSLFSIINVEKSSVTTAVALVIFGGLVVLSGLLKEDTLAKIQTWLSWIFGILTVLILVLFLLKAKWQEAFSLPSGSWITGVLPAVSIVAAGSWYFMVDGCCRLGSLCDQKRQSRLLLFGTLQWAEPFLCLS